MKRVILALVLTGLLSACGSGGTNPFDEPIAEEDPSTKNSQFLFDVEDKLTMNSVKYDAANDQLVINNLPFDGPDGRYDRVRTQGGVGVYRSRTTGTTGLVRHYAVFMHNDDMEVTAAAGTGWADTGYGGANVKRNGFNLPGGVGEYVYLGTYAGVRTRSDGSGGEIITGDARLLLDILDFDENGDGVGDGILEGAIGGTIFNRVRTDADTGAPLTAPIGNIGLLVVQYDPETGTFIDGIAQGYIPDEQGIRGHGTWEGLIGGSNGTSIGVNVLLDGTAEQQTIEYEVVRYTDPTSGEEFILSGYDANSDFDAINSIVDAGQLVPLLEVDRDEIPDGASFEVTIEETVIATSGIDAREIGVILAEQLPTQ